MTFLHVIILGIIEGITEFLPISSTGHMILASRLLGLQQTDFLKMFEVVIQLGAILAVVVLYAERLLKNFRLIGKTLLAFIPTAIAGLLLYNIIKKYLMDSPALVAWALIVGGVVIIICSYMFDRRGATKDEVLHTEDEISIKKALGVGTFQILAMVPGVSRSASTIIGGQLLGISKRTIVEFSFILAIPTMLAASGLDLLKNYHLLFDSANHMSNNMAYLLVGFIVSFLVALLAIKFFLKYVEKHSFTAFGVYRIILGVISLVLLGYFR